MTFFFFSFHVANLWFFDFLFFCIFLCKLLLFYFFVKVVVSVLLFLFLVIKIIGQQIRVFIRIAIRLAYSSVFCGWFQRLKLYGFIFYVILIIVRPSSFYQFLIKVLQTVLTKILIPDTTSIIQLIKLVEVIIFDLVMDNHRWQQLRFRLLFALYWNRWLNLF